MSTDAPRTRGAVLRHIMRLTWRADHTATVLLAVLVVFQSVAVALTGLSQRRLVDSAGLGTLTGLLGAVVVGAVSHAVSATCGRIQVNLHTDLADRVDIVVNEEVLTAAARVPTVEHLETPAHLDRIAVLRRGTKALAGVGWRLAEAASTAVSVLLSIILLMGVSPLLGLLVLLTLPPLWTGRRGQEAVRRARIACAEHQRLAGALHRLCTDPGSAKEIRITGAGPVLDEEARRAWDASVRTLYRADLRAAAWRLTGWACFTCGYLGALALVVWLVLRGSATLGDLMLVLTLGGRLRLQVRYTVENVGKVAEAGQAMDQYLWLHSYDRARRPSGADAPTTLSEGIRLDGVSFTYPGATRPALRDISLTLRPGTTVALVGDNGAGKSTLIKLLTGMYGPTAGTIGVDGRPATDISPASWRNRCTGAFQDFVAFELPLRESVAIGAHAGTSPPDETVDDALRRAGAWDFATALPEGTRTPLGPAHGGVGLSHGQWQRLALARAFVREGAVLTILDEPTAALDPQAEHDLYESFAREAERRPGRITVLVTHRFSTVHMADHIVVLDGGRVIEQGTREELMKAGGRYRRLHNLQARGYALDGTEAGRD